MTIEWVGSLCDTSNIQNPETKKGNGGFAIPLPKLAVVNGRAC
jgi:hypothetical protein